MKKVILFNFFIIIACSALFSQYNIQTAAGTGVAGHNDGNVINAQFNRPVGITSDVLGNVFIADFRNHCIRKITPNGIVSTIAGSPGNSGFADGNGSNARFNQPGGICVDNLGNIYVTDNFNHRIRKIDINNNVTTVAGNGRQGYVDSTGLQSSLNIPRDICYSRFNGKLYFPDRNNVVREYDPRTDRVSTFAGSGIPGFINGSSRIARFDFPSSIDIDINGNFIIADKDNHAIRRIDSNGIVSTIAGNGLAGYVNGLTGLSQFNQPVNASIDSLGNIYVTDFSNYRIRKINASGTVTTIAGDGIMGFANGIGTNSRIGEVFDLEIVNRNTIYFTDASNERIRSINNLTTTDATIENLNYSIEVFPNPASSIIYIRANTNSPISFEIRNTMGQIENIVNSNSESIKELNIESLSAGVYFISIFTEKGEIKETRKFIKK